jgi:hypothetical protein
MRILFSIFFLSVAALAGVAYFNWPARQLVWKNGEHLLQKYRGFCHYQEEGKSQQNLGTMLESTLGMAPHFPLGVVYELSHETNILYLDCSQGDHEVRIEIIQDLRPKKGVVPKFQLDSPLGHPMRMNIFVGNFFVQSEGMLLELDIPGQRLLLKSAEYVSLYLDSAGEVLHLQVLNGTLDLARSNPQPAESGLAQVIEISAGDQGAVSWEGRPALSPTQKTMIFPSGIVAPKSQTNRRGGLAAPSGANASKPGQR